MTQGSKWTWELTDPFRSGSSGDFAKLFKNEGVKNPGAFGVGAPSEHATLMAREVIQNSADSAAEAQALLGDDMPEFEMDFEFEALEGEAKVSFVEALDLRAVAARANNPTEPGWRAKLGLDVDGTLAHLDDATPLRTLRIVERGTTGMYGPMEGAKSKIYMALISLGYTAKGEGAGGSYGFGKAGLIRGSATRTIIAYTAFLEEENDPGVTRRLIGMTYWGQHDLDGVSYTGFARFGDLRSDGDVWPFENEAADEMAERLGLDVRQPNDPDDTGTTFLLIDPTVSADDLETAISRNWWPALEDGRLTVTVSEGGRYLIPRPMKDPLLKTFVDAYHLATTDQDNPKPNQDRRVMNRTTFGARKLQVGALGLVAEPGGWSYESDQHEDGNDLEHRSLVALVRGPRMVVEYFDAGRSRPFVRGVFVAHDDIDELLRQTEPKAHDSWQTSLDEPGTDPIAPEVADSVLTRIRSHVRRFREQLKPPPRPAEDVRLPDLERLFGRFFSSEGRTPNRPAAQERPFSINLDQQLEATSATGVRLTGKASFALMPHVQMETADVEVQVSYRFVEEGGAGEEAELAVVSPEGFEEVGRTPYRFRGVLSRDRVTFAFETGEYPSDWTGRLRGNVVFASDVGSDDEH